MTTQSQIKTVLLDMDGVLWQGSEPVIDIQGLFDGCKGLGLQVFCVTNNSTRTIDYHLERLSGYNVFLDRSQIVTSAEATAETLSAKFPRGGSLFVIGERGLKQALKKVGFEILDDIESDRTALAVVVGLDRDVVYSDLDLAVRHILKGAFFVGTNPDLTIPTPSDPAPGAGTIINAVEFSSGVAPYIIGKPFSPLYSSALDRAGARPEETIMIGDRLETDVLGAQQMGLRTALVLTGISTKEQAESWQPSPDMIADNALQVIERIEKFDG